MKFCGKVLALTYNRNYTTVMMLCNSSYATITVDIRNYNHSITIGSYVES